MNLSQGKKQIGILALSFLSINSILGLKNIPFASTIGPSAVFYWILAGLLYFVPISLIVAELSTTYSEQGGLSYWVQRAFGEKASFLSSWFFWIANFTYYPSLLITTTVNIAYALNRPGIAENSWITTLISISIFWIITLLTLRGTQMSGKLASIGAPLGVIVPALLIFGFGIAALLTGHTSATEFTFKSMMPNQISFDSIMFLSTLMFAFSGMEMMGTIAKDVKNPSKTFPRTILIVSVIISVIYILATLAFQFVIQITPDQTATALYLFAEKVSVMFHLPFNLSQVLGICFVLAIMGSLSYLILNPAIMIMESGRNILPKTLLKTNDVGMPSNIIIGQAIVVTLVLLLSGFISSVSLALNMLVFMSTLAFFVPYIFLIASYIKLRKTEPNTVRPFQIKGKYFPKIVAGVGLFSVLGTIILTLIPASGTTLLEYAPLVVGPVLFTLIGLVIYKRGSK